MARCFDRGNSSAMIPTAAGMNPPPPSDWKRRETIRSVMFDEIAQEVLGSIDEFAERIRMIGPDVHYVQLKQMQAAAHVQSATQEQGMRAMIEEADANLLVVIKEMREKR